MANDPYRQNWGNQIPYTSNPTIGVTGSAGCSSNSVACLTVEAGIITELVERSLTLPPTAITQGTATTGQVLTWDGTAWSPATPSASGISFAKGSFTQTGSDRVITTNDYYIITVTMTGPALADSCAITVNYVPASGSSAPQLLTITALKSFGFTNKIDVCLMNHFVASNSMFNGDAIFVTAWNP